MDLNILEQRAKAFDHLFDAVVVTDEKGTIVDWNSGSELLYGYTKEEALGQPASILHVPEDVDRITILILSSVEKFGKWNGELRYLHNPGLCNRKSKPFQKTTEITLKTVLPFKYI
jgi:PAS domain S-box-containing protein